MSKVILSLAFGGAVMLTASGAQAFPAAPPTSTQPSSNVIQVAGGCGPGWHRGPRGGCRPNRGVVVVAPGPRCWWRATPRGRVRVCR